MISVMNTSSTLLDLLNLLIAWTRRFEEQLWKLRARWDPRFAGSALVARRLDLPTLVEYVFLERMSPDGLRGLFSTYAVPPDLAERCAHEFERRVGREIEAEDFDRSRSYWRQYELERGKPAYVPIGVESIRATLSKPLEELAPPVSAEPVAQPSLEPVPEPLSRAPVEDVLLRDDWYEHLLPKREPLPEAPAAAAERVIVPSAHASQG